MFIRQASVVMTNVSSPKILLTDKRICSNISFEDVLEKIYAKAKNWEVVLRAGLGKFSKLN